jgi:hypothetical protein
MKLRRSPRRKLRVESGSEKGRITGLEGVVRDGLLVPGERWGTRAEIVGKGESDGGRRSRSVSRVDDRVAAGYDGFRGNGDVEFGL